MAKKRIVLELGQGTSLRREDYSKAAERAVKNALWQNSLNVAEAFGFDKSDMIVEVLLGSQQPEKIDRDKIKDIFPYGVVTIESAFGGLDVCKPDGGGKTIIVTAAVIVSFEMEVS
ncbi:MAG: Lin0512 family protein [Paracoccaceae bacterium]|nr:Lin0512 family protein [Paracoccaceae bacterium]